MFSSFCPNEAFEPRNVATARRRVNLMDCLCEVGRNEVQEVAKNRLNPRLKAWATSRAYSAKNKVMNLYAE
jgi:stage V sporulation protein SpoVS